MLYVLGVNLPGNKCVRIALSAFYGIGNKTSKRICDKLHLSPQLRVNSLTDLQMNFLVKEIKNYTIEMDLRKQIKNHIDQLIIIKSYRGLRHSHGLPVRGQRTRTNGKTQKYLSRKSYKPLKIKVFKKSKVKEKKKIIIKKKKKK